MTHMIHDTHVLTRCFTNLGEVNLRVTNDGTGETTDVHFVVVPNKTLSCRKIP